MLEKLDILVVDDHPFFRDAICSVLKYRPYVSGLREAGNGLECLQRLSEKEADVVLLDISMPEMDGINCLRIIRRDFPEVKVVVLTQFSESKFSKIMLQNGAIGYLLKSTTQGEFIVDFEDIIFKNQIIVDPNVGAQISDGRPDDQHPLLKELTSREIEVLRLVGQHHTSQQIADALDISYNTVANHRKSLLRKLNVENPVALLRLIKENNLFS